jgi:TolB protein
MSDTIDQVATLRRLARVYRRILVLAVPAALAACQGSGDSLAPDLAAPAAEPAAVDAEPAAAPLAALATDRIAFTSLTADGADIWTMGPGGGSPTRLTSFTGVESRPSWSWDHKRIAFVRLRGAQLDIYLMNADGTNNHWARSTTYPYAIDQPSWSPDGSHLLVRVNFLGQKRCVAKLDLATGNLTALAPAGVLALEANFPIYGKDGKTIFYVDGTQQTIRRFTPGGAGAAVLAVGKQVADLALSPDGSKLAYDEAVSGANTEIYVLNLATKVAKRLTYNSASDGGPTWSPDGTKIAFGSERANMLQIWTMNSSTGGSVTRISDRPRGAYSPAWVR